MTPNPTSTLPSTSSQTTVSANIIDTLPIIPLNKNTNENESNNGSIFTPTPFLNVDNKRPRVKEFTAKCINKINLSVLEKNFHSSLQSNTQGGTSVHSEQSPRLVSCGNSSDVLNSADAMGAFPDVTDSSYDNSQSGSLKRDSSLVDLAYIPVLNETTNEPPLSDGFGEMTFIDFPNDIEQVGNNL